MAQAARQRAQDFADHLNSVLNKTATEGRLTLVAHDDAPLDFDVISRDRALKLNGCRLWLFVSQRVQVEGAKVHTLLYSYRLQTTAADRRGSWLVRWEYLRERPSDNPYVLSHLHVRGSLDNYKPPKPLPDMHIPTDRVPLELVLWHLLTDWNVKPLSDAWQGHLADSIEGFKGRRTV
jgi:hypothetical protein